MLMKQFRKKKIQKRIWIVLAILILPAFVLWGAGSVTRGGKQEENYVGRIFGKKISLLQYKDAWDATKNLTIIQYGDNFQEVAKSLDFDSQVWERLLLVTEAKRRRIKVNDGEVIDFIQSYPFFQRNGKFDQRLYSEMLQYVFRTQPRAFEEQSRENIMIAKLYKDVTGKLALSDQEIKDEYKKLNEEASLFYIGAAPADFIKEVAVNDKTLREYFDKESLQFKQPLNFNLEYAAIPVDDKDPSEKRVKAVFSRLQKKESFAKVTKENNLALKETGLFAENDSIPGLGWSPQITLLIAKAKIGSYLLPIKIENNYYILKLKERIEPRIPSFETIKDKVKEKFIQDKSREIAETKTKQCLAALKETSRSRKPLNFAASARDFALKSGETGLFKYGTYIGGIGASDDFWLAAENLRENEFSEIISTPSGFYIIKVKSRSTVDEKKFAAEKETFSKTLLGQRKQEYFLKFGEELKSKAQRF